ncbi:LysR family transcriptional regulator [Pannonibacter phragmitetus]|uniref:LysR family transcriptional regulator n=1 Tax=Pannonibacter phragmitetus TaxID=121719 RepID=UPI003D2F139A
MSDEKGFRKIDLNLLLVFEAIYKTGNISLAAKQLGVSQPTVSNAIARLRTQLGGQLFTRQDRGVAPTTFADTITPRAAGIVYAARRPAATDTPLLPLTLRGSAKRTPKCASGRLQPERLQSAGMTAKETPACFPSARSLI